MKKEKIVFEDIKEMPFLCASVSDMLWNHTGSWRYIRPRYIEQIPPCNSGCPVGQDVEEWIELISRGKYKEAFDVIRMENPFPSITGRVCFHPCEKKCNRKELGGAVSINMLEQFVSDINVVPEPALPLFPEGGFNVAVVGSGPAGLSCAFHLRRLGHSVTVFEKREMLGGMLRYGIPSYRLPKDILDKEIENLKKMGVKFFTSKEVNPAQIKLEFDKIFIAYGAHSSKKMGAEDEDGQGVMSGLSFLSKVLSGEKVDTGKKVLVIGGGNTAIDSALVVMREGATVVKILYRRTRVEMPAFDEEIKQAEDEGIKIEILTAPKKVLRDEKGKTIGLLCIKMKLGEKDSSGRARPIPIENSDFAVPCDTIISAIGEDVELKTLASLVEVKNGLVKVNDNLSTTDEKIFAGGDMIDQPRTVIDAIASGQKAAIAIDCEHRDISYKEIANKIKGASPSAVSMKKYINFLKGKVGTTVVKNHVVEFKELNLNYFEEKKRNERPKLSVKERFVETLHEASLHKIGNYKEIHLPINPDYAKTEVERCFHCGRCIECDNCFIFCPDVSIKPLNEGFYSINYDFCKGCGLCVHECPRSAMEMIEEPNE